MNDRKIINAADLSAYCDYINISEVCGAFGVTRSYVLILEHLGLIPPRSTGTLWLKRDLIGADFNIDLLQKDVLGKILDYNPATGGLTWIYTFGTKASKEVNGAGKIEPPVGRNKTPSRTIQLCGKKYQALKIAWLLQHGEYPTGRVTTINKTPTDLKASNLIMMMKESGR